MWKIEMNDEQYGCIINQLVNNVGVAKYKLATFIENRETYSNEYFQARKSELEHVASEAQKALNIFCDYTK